MNLPFRPLAYGLAGVLAAIGMFVADWEGIRLSPYFDSGGTATVCRGHIAHVEDREYTLEECDRLYIEEVREHTQRMLRCIHVPLTRNQVVAFASASFNLGTGIICNSAAPDEPPTIGDLINSGRARYACEKLLEYDGVWKYDRNGKRIPGSYRKIRGLTNRRKAERDLCLKPDDVRGAAALS